MTNMEKMNRTKLKLSDLNPHLMCVLCGGYYIDATTIVECLHSFCRSCIVKHLESSKYCPICEVQVHKTKPLINIRPDKTLQDIVYKLVPGLFANEMRNRRKFYRERPHYMKPNDSESVGEVSDETKIYINDENITLSLNYHKSSKQDGLEDSFREITTPVKSEKRYFKCPTGVTVYHLQKLLKAKYDLNDSNYKVEIFFKDQPLHEDFTLLDISYIYLWKSKGTLDLTYKIYENIIKRQKIEEAEAKEETVEERKEIDVRLEPVQSLKEEGKVKEEPISPAKPSEPEPETVKTEVEAEVKATSVETVGEKAKTAETVRHNGVSGEESKEVQLQISESGVMSVSQIENGDVVRTVEESAAKTVDGFRNKSNTGKSVAKTIAEPVRQQPTPNRLVPEQSKQPPKPIKPYKTIRCSPKSWNPVIPKEKLRPTLMKNSDEPKKPLKFFKMRNMPRFLGNPASGVKPMFADSSENDARPSENRKDSTRALKNILKIDPKTLRPIEKEDLPIISTPSTPNLLTNPFIPNNNHFLFGDPLLLHPNYSNSSKPEKHNNNNNSSNNNNNNNTNNNSNSSNVNNSSNCSNNSSGKASGSSRPPVQNGTFPPICFPSPDYCSSFFPYQSNFSKHGNFYPSGEKLDPLIRASQLSPFANLSSFNVAGFHANLPSISLVLKHQSSHHHPLQQQHQHRPHQHHYHLKRIADKKTVKEESTKESNKNCDDHSLRVEGKEGRLAESCVEKKSEPAKEEENKKKNNDIEVKPDETEDSTKMKEKEEEKKGEKKVKEEKVEEEKAKLTSESTCQDAPSACKANAKPETVNNNDDKSVNDQER